MNYLLYLTLGFKPGVFLTPTPRSWSDLGTIFSLVYQFQKGVKGAFVERKLGAIFKKNESIAICIKVS